MEITETIYPADRRQWREWLSENFESGKEIWLMVPL